MMNWLYSFPDLSIVVSFAAILAVAIVGLPSLVRRIPWMKPSDANTDFVLRMQATLFTMTSLVLAFTLVEAENNFRKVDALVSAEASQLNRLDRLLSRYGDPAAEAVRPPLLAYAQSIVNDEWPAMLEDMPSEKTRAAFMPISRGILSLDPQTNRQTMIYGEILRSFDAVAESRDARLAAVSVALPAAYWQVVLFAALMLLFVSSTMERTPFRATVLAAQMAVIGAFLGFVFIQDQPFKGQMAVDAEPIVQAIAVIKSRKDQ
jgi:hypothetical protein